MLTTQLQLQPIEGAAKYQAFGCEVRMLPTDGSGWTTVDSAKTHDKAVKKANRWQVKENMAVSRAKKNAAK